MRDPRIMHVKADLLGCIRDISFGELQVLECTSQAAVVARIL